MLLLLKSTEQAQSQAKHEERPRIQLVPSQQHKAHQVTDMLSNHKGQWSI